MRLAAALAIVGPLLAISINVASGNNFTWSFTHSEFTYPLAPELWTILLGGTFLAFSFLRFGLKHGRLLISLITLLIFTVQMAETFADYEPTAALQIPMHIAILMFIATGLAPYRVWHLPILGVAFYWAGDLGVPVHISTL